MARFPECAESRTQKVVAADTETDAALQPQPDSRDAIREDPVRFESRIATGRLTRA
jgi:hypothetical protein